MAKTIEKMAGEYADNIEELFADEQQYCFEAYIAGANAVLEEIESCYNKDDSLCVISHKIISKIQQLKGE